MGLVDKITLVVERIAAEFKSVRTDIASGGVALQGEIDALSDVVATKATTSNVDAQLAGKANAADLDNVFTIATAAAPANSPVLTGNPQAPTPTVGDNDTSIATTAFVTTAVSGVSTPDASTTVKGKVELATDAEMQEGTDATKGLVASQVVNAQGETMLAKVQFIPLGGTVTGSPGPYTIIIEAGA